MSQSSLLDLLLEAQRKKQATKHKVFISYYHKEDQYYKKRFDELFGHLFISKSVEPGDIDKDTSDAYIKQLIQKDFISDASVLIVLVGNKTYCRKHVDWEISAALNKKVGGYSGLIGLCLPGHSACGKQNYKSDDVPARLVDNLKSDYAGLYDWTTDESTIKQRVEQAFKDRIDKADKIDNSRIQFTYNRCD